MRCSSLAMQFPQEYSVSQLHVCQPRQADVEGIEDFKLEAVLRLAITRAYERPGAECRGCRVTVHCFPVSAEGSAGGDNGDGCLSRPVRHIME